MSEARQFRLTHLVLSRRSPLPISCAGAGKPPSVTSARGGAKARVAVSLQHLVGKLFFFPRYCRGYRSRFHGFSVNSGIGARMPSQRYSRVVIENTWCCRAWISSHVSASVTMHGETNLLVFASLLCASSVDLLNPSATERTCCPSTNMLWRLRSSFVPTSVSSSFVAFVHSS